MYTRGIWMSKLVRIDEDCEAILRKYSDGSISDCIRAMQQKLTLPQTFTQYTAKEIEDSLKRVLLEGVNLSSKERLNFQNLNRTLVEVISKNL